MAAPICGPHNNPYSVVYDRSERHLVYVIRIRSRCLFFGMVCL